MGYDLPLIEAQKEQLPLYSRAVYKYTPLSPAASRQFSRAIAIWMPALIVAAVANHPIEILMTGAATIIVHCLYLILSNQLRNGKCYIYDGIFYAPDNIDKSHARKLYDLTADCRKILADLNKKERASIIQRANPLVKQLGEMMLTHYEVSKQLNPWEENGTIRHDAPQTIKRLMGQKEQLDQEIKSFSQKIEDFCHNARRENTLLAAAETGEKVELLLEANKVRNEMLSQLMQSDNELVSRAQATDLIYLKENNG